MQSSPELFSNAINRIESPWTVEQSLNRTNYFLLICFFFISSDPLNYLNFDGDLVTFQLKYLCSFFIFLHLFTFIYNCTN